MKILLIYPKAQTDPEWGGDLGATAEPLALEYLAAAVKKIGDQVRLLDLRLNPDALDSTLAEFEPDLVGATAFSMHVRAVLAVFARVKAKRPSCWTIAGGHHAAFLPEDFFEDQVDFVVTGDGVRPLVELSRRLSDGAAPTGIPGLWSRVEGKFVFGGDAPPLVVDALPVPDRSITAGDRASYFIDWMKPVALVRTSVGCPYRCSFCSLWQLMEGRYLMREIDAVVEELATIKEEFVFLVDDEAFINGARMARLAAALKDAGIYRRFFAYCRIDTLLRQREVVAAWRQIGLERLFIGVDAISKKDLAEYNKRLQLSQIEAGLRTAAEIGVEVLAQFVVNTNYTRQDFREIERFVEHHKIAYPSFTVLTPLPGTDLLKNFDHVIERQPNGRPNWDLFDTQHAVTATRLPKEEFRREYRDLFRKFKGAYSLHRDRDYSRGQPSLVRGSQAVAV